jgi:Protein of unknown function (DUF4235)
VAKRKRGVDKKASKGKASWRMIGAGSALAAGVVAARVLDLIWATATGRKPPSTPESPDIAHREALVWAALSGMAIGVAKTYATRRAARYWLRSTGELPPGMADDASAADQQAIAS